MQEGSVEEYAIAPRSLAIREGIVPEGWMQLVEATNGAIIKSTLGNLLLVEATDDAIKGIRNSVDEYCHIERICGLSIDV